MSNNIHSMNEIIKIKQSEIFHIESALSNLKLVCSLQSKNGEHNYREETNKMIEALTFRVEDLKLQIAAYEREFKRTKQQDNDQIVMSAGYI